MLSFSQYLKEHQYYHDAKARQWGYFKGRRIIDGLKTEFKTYSFQKRGTHGALAHEAGLGSMEKALADGWIRFAVLRNGESLFDFAFRDEKDCSAALRSVIAFLDKSPLVHGDVTIDAMQIAPDESIDLMWHHQIASGRWDSIPAAQRAVRTAIANKAFDRARGWSKDASLEGKYEDDFDAVLDDAVPAFTQ